MVQPLMEARSMEKNQTSVDKVRKNTTVEEVEDEEEEEEEEEKVGVVSGKKGSIGFGRVSLPCCLAESCGADLSLAKRYHRRHKVCELHSKAPIVLVSGLRQRFCQQCSRFHELAEFDEAKRSCRRRLARHNERRRKSSSTTGGTHNEGSSGIHGEHQLHPLESHFGNDINVCDWRQIQMNIATRSSSGHKFLRYS